MRLSLIRFSYAINMSRPQESSYMQTTYKKRKHLKTHHLIPQLAAGSLATYYIYDKYFDTTVIFCGPKETCI